MKIMTSVMMMTRIIMRWCFPRHICVFVADEIADFLLQTVEDATTNCPFTQGGVDCRIGTRRLK